VGYDPRRHFCHDATTQDSASNSAKSISTGADSNIVTATADPEEDDDAPVPKTFHNVAITDPCGRHPLIACCEPDLTGSSISVHNGPV
jgi:hypothetical protein